MLLRFLPHFSVCVTILAAFARYIGADAEIILMASNPTLRLIFLAAVAFVIGIPVISTSGHTAMRS